MDRKVKYKALCINRHHMKDAIDGSIYPKKLNLQDTDRLNARARKVVSELAAEGDSLVLYISGAQYPLVAVINACIEFNVELVLMHWNPETEQYYPQRVYTARKEI